MEPGIKTMNSTNLKPVSLKEYLLYFLKLGSLGFGGPIVLASHMRRDLVDSRQWASPEEYENGLALAQLAPGPLAAQLAIFLGWVRFGNLGATLVAGAFIAPSFLIVVVLSELYVKYSGLPWIQGAFYGIGAAVIAIMVLGVQKLARRAIGTDRLFAAIAIVTAIITVATQQEIIWIFLAAGLLAVLVKTPPSQNSRGMAAFVIPTSLVTGLVSPADTDLLWRIFLYFAKAGAFVFGSGLAIVPFLHSGVVRDYGWLTEQQFLDAVAIAMITPGPVVITVGFIGYLVAGLAGAVAAALGVFLPCYLLVIIPAPYVQKYSKVPMIKAFIGGVTAAAIGAIAGAAFVLGKRAIVDLPTIMIFCGAIFMLLKVKKLPEPVLIMIAGLVGFGLKFSM